ncbi:MAG: hypothetical protein NW220_00615 [Leptolyngbyaceae cyanobacterium bins.349]|nr:hypothetical protein [Leptolyngbyaceae cyanobacterium bins.349]
MIVAFFPDKGILLQQELIIERVLMSSVGLNKWIVSGHLAADAEIKTVDLKSGEKAKVAKATIYVRKLRNREASFTVALNIWEGSTAWRKLAFLKKGSLIICTGSVEPNPYISNSDNLPRAGLTMNVLDVDLDSVRFPEDEETSTEVTASQALGKQHDDPSPVLTSPALTIAPEYSQTPSVQVSPSLATSNQP